MTHEIVAMLQSLPEVLFGGDKLSLGESGEPQAVIGVRYVRDDEDFVSGSKVGPIVMVPELYGALELFFEPLPGLRVSAFGVFYPGKPLESGKVVVMLLVNSGKKPFGFHGIALLQICPSQ
jgi:hypothetical protein